MSEWVVFEGKPQQHMMMTMRHAPLCTSSGLLVVQCLQQLVELLLLLLGEVLLDAELTIKREALLLGAPRVQA